MILSARHPTLSALVLVLLATPAWAWAQTVQNITVPAIAEGGTSITVNQSPSTAVDIQTDLTATIAGTATVTSFEQRAGSVAVGGSSIVAVSLASIPIGSATAAGSANGNVAAGAADIVAFTGSAFQSIVTTGAGASAAPLIGTGQAQLGLSAYTYGQLAAPLNVDAAIRTTAGAGVKLTYQPASGGGANESYGGSGSGIAGNGGGGSFVLNGATTTAVQTRVVAPATTGWTQALDFGRFDPTLGQLLSVNVTIHGTLADSFSITNRAHVVSGFQLLDQSALSLVGPGGVSLVSSNLTTISFGNLGQADTFGATDAGSAASADFSAQTGGDWTPTDLALFNGSGDIMLNLDSTASLYAQSGGNWDIHSRGQAGATVTLDYVYDPHGTPLPATAVPEPPVRLLFGLGIALTLLAHRRQRNRG